MLDVEVLTPEGEVFNGEVRMVSTRTEVGEIGILANHAPLLGALRPTTLKLKVSESETKEWAQAHGWLQVYGNRARLLIEEAIPPEELDASALKRSSPTPSSGSPTAMGLRRVPRARQRPRHRAEAFLSITVMGEGSRHPSSGIESRALRARLRMLLRAYGAQESDCISRASRHSAGGVPTPLPASAWRDSPPRSDRARALSRTSVPRG